MMDVWSACSADINIVDAIHPASGYSPHTPVHIDLGCILGSYDPVAVDRIACELVGIDPDMVDYFKVASEVICASRGFGSIIMTYPTGALSKMPDIKALLQIPENRYYACFVAFGYPEIKYARGVQREDNVLIHEINF